MMKVYWWPAKNFGDTLSRPIIEFFSNEAVSFADRDDEGKILAVGSILAAMRPNDTVWGSGWNKPRHIAAPSGVKFLVVRGPITAKMVKGCDTKIYGDPGLLLPLMYRGAEKPEKKYKVGVIPHYVDKPFVKLGPDDKLIDIQAEWRKVVDDILECETIVSSSLHGIIAAEAYGIPTKWAIWSDKIVGGKMKFQDYFLGTGRGEQEPFKELPPIERLDEIQKRLLTITPWKTN